MLGKQIIQVLLVEDSPTDVFLVREAFTDLPLLDAKVTHTERLADAIISVESRKFDIILLDLGLPDSQGIDTFIQLHNITENIPILILTSNTDEFTGVRALHDGAHDYLIKSEVKAPVLGRAVLYALERVRLQRESEEELLEREELYRSIVSSMAEGIIVMKQDQNILAINNRAEEILGISKLKLTSETATDIWKNAIQVDGSPFLFEHQPSIKTLNSGKAISNVTMGIHKADHSLVWISMNCQPIFKTFEAEPTSVIISFNDVTNQIEAEKSLVSSEARFRTVFNNVAIGIVLSDREGNSLDINPALEKMLGYKYDELIDKNFNEFVHNDDKHIDSEEYQKLKNGEVENYFIEKRFLKSDGSDIWGSLSVSLIRDHEEPVLIVSMVEDITEKKKLKEQFIQSQKLEGIGLLAGGIAHDFNNILTVINGYCELLLNKINNKGPLMSLLLEIRSAGERAKTLTSQLLSFGRRQIIQPKNVNLNTAINNIEKMLGRLIGEKIQVIKKFDKNIFNINIDPGQLDQVIMNLTINARDAMPNGGKLTFKTSNVYLDESYAKQHIAVVPGDYVLLTISDSGLGMNRETQSRIFEPFFTTKEQSKGTGLGLSTIYGIVKQAKGIVWVYSEVNIGTTFKLYFPAVGDLESVCEENQYNEESFRGSETILVVEDDKSVRKITCGYLDIYGYDIIEAINVNDAIEIVKKGNNHIELMVSDVIMPEMSGGKLAEEIHKIKPDLKVLFVTGYADTSVIKNGILNKGVNLLTKPFGAPDLAKKVREILDKK